MCVTIPYGCVHNIYIYISGLSLSGTDLQTWQELLPWSLGWHMRCCTGKLVHALVHAALVHAPGTLPTFQNQAPND